MVNPVQEETDRPVLVLNPVQEETDRQVLVLNPVQEETDMKLVKASSFIKINVNLRQDNLTKKVYCK